jgi:hypothetical protein
MSYFKFSEVSNRTKRARIERNTARLASCFSSYDKGSNSNLGASVLERNEGENICDNEI